MTGRKSLAELVAELDDPAPKDIDPEAFGQAEKGSNAESDASENAGREHYEAVGKSKLRTQAHSDLGSRYRGAKVSREDLERSEDNEHDPFGHKEHSESDERGSDAESYDDPDEVDLAMQDDEDEEIDSDEAFEDGEEEMFREKGFTFKDSSKAKPNSTKKLSGPSKLDEEHNDQEGESQGEGDESSLDAEFDELQMNGTSDSDMDSEENDEDASQTSDSEDEAQAQSAIAAAFGATAPSSEQSIVSKLSRGMGNEALQGAAIKKQYESFDSLVGARVHLQKSLIAANTLPQATGLSSNQTTLAEAAQAAENAAIEVFNSLTSLLHNIRSTHFAQAKTSTVLGKRSFAATASTPSQDIEQVIQDSHRTYRPYTRARLEKWAAKTQERTVSIRSGLSQKPVKDSMLNAIDGQLLGSNQERLLQKTRIARSCAPLQQTSEIPVNSKANGIESDEDIAIDPQAEVSTSIPIYDDADFYASILRELIDHKRSYTKTTSSWIPNSTLTDNTTPSNLLRGNKTKRANLDTKASKGRKMKYNVHEKLRNFLAPVDLGTWERRQAEELFAGLLGRKVVSLDETDDVQITEVGEEDLEMQGLRLFGGR